MNLYRIVNAATGADFGTYIASSERNALESHAILNGFPDAIAMHVATHAPGDLRDYQTGESIRPATAAEYALSLRGGPEGVIAVDGRSCYVDGTELGHGLWVCRVNVSVTLRSGSAGLDSGEQYNAWTAFVIENIDKRLGYEVSVSVDAYHRGGSDHVRSDDEGDDTEILENVRGVLITLWEEWCAQ